MEQFFFYMFAIAAVVSAVLVISVRNPVHSAFYLIVCFLAAVQLFIYVGAIMVLFLFAVLVLDIGREQFRERFHGQTVPALAAIAGLFVVMGILVVSGKITAPLGPFDEPALMKNTEVIGKSLYTSYIFPFEIVSILLLIALIGAVVLVMSGQGKENKG
ncbi:MAG: hypothetical protein A2X93_06240 [Deltaproteobacteria bacterium GWC2_56_8]|nr:MAG: hypothetical protein A2X93_06240 [Deltaproteobacteria bacterium GWC2_56_8]